MRDDEKIQVKMTANGETTEAVVLRKRAEIIQVVLGKGVHSVTCDLKPTRNGLAYSGVVMGREIVYERVRMKFVRTESTFSPVATLPSDPLRFHHRAP